MPKKPLLVFGLSLIIAVGLTALWRWTPLADWFSVEALTNWAGEFKRRPTAPIWIVAAFIVAGQLFFPITLLGLATVLAFGPVLGTIYSVIGSLLSGLVTYGIGRMLGEATVCRLAGPKLQQVRQQIKRHGLTASITVHILPVAPFTLVNLLSGACGVGVRDFTLGTLIGHLPGVISIIIFQGQLERAMRSPGPLNITLLVVVIAGVTLGTLWLQRQMGKRAAA